MFSFFKKKTPFIPLYNLMAIEMKEGKILTPSGDKFKSSTARNYKNSVFVLKNYEKEKGTIYLEDIDLKWAEQFRIFMMQQGYAKNAIAIILTRLKAILKRLHQNGIGKFSGAGINTGMEQVTTVYSTMEDLQLLLNYDFSTTPGFERIRDVYILNCFIGLRYNDLMTVLKFPENYLREVGLKLFFEIKTQKTGEIVVIPIGKMPKLILHKYNYNFGELFSMSYFNRDIKEVARRAGIIQEIIFTRTKGGERIDTPLQKCELMSSHSARRTFATNAFLSGMPEKNIMLITGHKTTQAFYRYVRCSNLDAAIKIANHDFFSIEFTNTVQIENSNGREIEIYRGTDC